MEFPFLGRTVIALLMIHNTSHVSQVITATGWLHFFPLVASLSNPKAIKRDQLILILPEVTCWPLSGWY